jgi:hypothetical protein
MRTSVLRIRISITSPAQSISALRRFRACAVPRAHSFLFER